MVSGNDGNDTGSDMSEDAGGGGVPARFLPWDAIALGTNLALEDVTARQLLKSAGMDWDVEKRPAYRRLKDNSFQPWPGHWDVRRADTEQSLGHVLSDYQPLANRAAFSFGDVLVQEDVGRWVSAGQTYDFVNVIMVMQLTAPFTAAGQQHDMYLVISTSHNGTSGVRGFAVPVLSEAKIPLATSASTWLVGVRHSGDMEAKLQQASEAIRKATEAGTDYRETTRRLSEVPLSDDRAREIVSDLTGDKTAAAVTKAEAISGLYENDPDIKRWKGTALGLLAAWNLYAAHYARYRTDQARYAGLRTAAAASEKLAARLLAVT